MHALGAHSARLRLQEPARVPLHPLALIMLSALRSLHEKLGGLRITVVYLRHAVMEHLSLCIEGAQEASGASTSR